MCMWLLTSKTKQGACRSTRAESRQHFHLLLRATWRELCSRQRRSFKKQYWTVALQQEQAASITDISATTPLAAIRSSSVATRKRKRSHGSLWLVGRQGPCVVEQRVNASCKPSVSISGHQSRQPLRRDEAFCRIQSTPLSNLAGFSSYSIEKLLVCLRHHSTASSRIAVEELVAN